MRGHAYTAYLVLLFGLVYFVPVLYTASTTPALISVGSLAAATPVAWALAAAVAACWGAQLAGRFWGPLVIQPFLLHVFMSTDISPAHYLGAIARRRLAFLSAATVLSVSTATYLTTDLFDRLGTSMQGLAVAVGLGALTAAAWLWGQVRAVSANLRLATAVGALACVLMVLSRVGAQGGAGLWLVAGGLAITAAAVGRAAFRSIGAIDLARLARESARASQAQAYAWTGTLHHALDLYRPEPRGRGSALIREDGRLRGHLAAGALRALRTPGRATAAAVLLLTGGVVLPFGTSGSNGGLTLVAWVVGSVCVYLGSGWVSESWRGLRDELTLVPLFGEWWGGTLTRAMAWPVVAVTVVTFMGTGLAAASQWHLFSGQLMSTGLLTAGSTVLALGARFLREMKLQLPLELLLPVNTPLGDMSGLRIVAWQFDGVVAVVIGVGVMHALPSAAGATALALGMAAACVWGGLRRTGWAHPGLVSRLRRV
ncbi:hypothetical protein RM572_12210 [Streptomyces sp. DSM 42041]|uniref:Tat pathway signal sequence domain protein n=1 Tax=Streptomyces hazeniae TaxID=3075538 RepID=A0ABU2NRB7_9ACTN|nr:hypothetical protein [Streptomyces sp. DSM 42041]MDT0379528.1 hypothetical protein [Streptomyces sp. DSM 42041]